MTNVIRNLTVLGALAVLAVPSLAVNLQFNFQGVVAGAGTSATPFTVSAAKTPGLDSSSSPVASILYNFTGSVGGTVTGAGSISFDPSFSTLSPVFFTFTGGLNADKGLNSTTLAFYGNAAHTVALSGGGAFSHSMINTTDSTLQGQFTGAYNPVPEPASLAAMALGVTGLLARRKKGAR